MNMVMSRRVSDTKAEKEVSNFLDKYFYERHVDDFVRFDDVNHQFLGMDVTFSIGKLKGIIVDEKAQIDYVNRHLPTFAFEIDFMNAANIYSKGWFLDDSKKTQFYLLIWVTSRKEKDFMREDIDKLDCILISREELIRYLCEQGLDEEKIYHLAKEIRVSGIYGRHHTGLFKDAYFFLSTQKRERPINLIIRIERIKELAELMFTVSNKDGKSNVSFHDL